ncbi:hypothetical protein PF005_g2505 [Phytophthora fragariae]|uniref:Uncharacterized protein n=2 Tax=Phytophthora TaxID=4783 RepID=A0A6A4A8Y2_9STRA|nr:hypothetical protein PF003_g29790 [Phytophthora fragariae]KAE9030811.1 hypothetical protein PR001_g11165 [Phytophthora rubi]KAE8947696.1 hypothetical protein PF009_g2698 [Phytophthora fragariae]KAE9027603.1 hypothetical protein PF011_g1968 [Phytophthora fragariae]KAE9135643.1 hypothetical protein PF007_g2492 [Phytophthora fragariae]
MCRCTGKSSNSHILLCLTYCMAVFRASDLPFLPALNARDIQTCPIQTQNIYL